MTPTENRTSQAVQKLLAYPPNDGTLGSICLKYQRMEEALKKISTTPSYSVEKLVADNPTTHNEIAREALFFDPLSPSSDDK